MTDPGERLRSSLAADQSSAGSSSGMADFDSPIAMEAMRATRVLHAADQEPFPAPEPDPRHHDREPEGRRRQDDVDGEPRVSPWRSTACGPWSSTWTRRATRAPRSAWSTRSARPSVYDALVGDSSLAEVVHPTTASPKLLCVPATIDLAGAEIELVSVVAREHRLRRAIEAYVHGLPPEQRPHYVLIDCPPSLGLLTLNALVAGDEVLIPIQCEYYALEGLGQLLNNIDLVRQHLNPGISVRTILLTMYDGRTKLADQVADEVRNHFGDLVLQAVIPRNVRVSEAPGLRPVGAHLRPGLAGVDQLRRGGPPARRARRRTCRRSTGAGGLRRTAPPVAAMSSVRRCPDRPSQ